MKSDAGTSLGRIPQTPRRLGLCLFIHLNTCLYHQVGEKISHLSDVAQSTILHTARTRPKWAEALSVCWKEQLGSFWTLVCMKGTHYATYLGALRVV